MHLLSVSKGNIGDDCKACPIASRKSGIMLYVSGAQNETSAACVTRITD
jgi:hypothetical protein